MTDIVTDEAPKAETNIIKVPVVKAKTTIDVDLNKLPDDVYKEALQEGCKVLINSHTDMNKIKGETFPDEDERKAAALACAEARVTAMMENRIKLKAAKAATTSGAVMTEARRLAKIIVKDKLRNAGQRVSHYAASEITAAANELIKLDPGLVAQAEKNLAERGKLKVDSIDTVVAGLTPDTKLVAKAEADKAARKASKGTLSAKQAGKTAPHGATAH